jgi:hypothetical protein
MSLRRTLSPVGRPLRRSSLGSLRLARTRSRERCNLPLERGHAVGKRLNRELRLWAGNLGERHLEHKALVGSHAHLGRGIGEQLQGTRHTVDRAKGLRLAREGRKVVVGGRGYARTHANGRDHVHVAQARSKRTGKLQQVATNLNQALYLRKQTWHITVCHA